MLFPKLVHIVSSNHCLLCNKLILKSGSGNQYYTGDLLFFLLCHDSNSLFQTESLYSPGIYYVLQDVFSFVSLFLCLPSAGKKKSLFKSSLLIFLYDEDPKIYHPYTVRNHIIQIYLIHVKVDRENSMRLQSYKKKYGQMRKTGSRRSGLHQERAHGIVIQCQMSPENIHVSNNIWTQYFIFRNLQVYKMHICI